MSPPLVETRANGDVVLAPLSSAELAGVLDDLGRKVKLNPGLTLHPLTMLMVRLAVTASKGVETNGHGEAPADSEELTALHKELQTALDRLQETEKGAQELNGLVSQANAATRKAERDLEEEKRRSATARLAEAGQAKLQGDVDKLNKEYILALAMLNGDDPDAKHIEGSPLAVRVQGVLNDLARMTSRYGALQASNHPSEALATRLQKEVNILTAQAGAAQKKEANFTSELENVRAKRNELRASLRSVTDALKAYQWSAVSREHKFKGGKRCPCCPVCGGLDPNIVGSHPSVNHRKGCSLSALIRRL
jgi:DNA repair exonuclease SbcCD ATPase subunit